MPTSPIAPTAEPTTFDWIVTNDAQLQHLAIDLTTPLPEPYRLCRLLANIDDILDRTDDDHQRLAAITPRVRH